MALVVVLVAFVVVFVALVVVLVALVVEAALVVVLVAFVVVLVAFVVEEGLVFWHEAPLQNPVMAPLTQGTPCFLRTEVSQVIPAEHLGLLAQGPVLLPQIWPTLLKVHWPGTPGALQHAPPSHCSLPSFFPLPQKAWMVPVLVNDPVMEGEKETEPVEVKDGVMELDKVREPVGDTVSVTVTVPDGVPVKELVAEKEMETVPVKDLVTDPVKEIETELEKLVETEFERL